MWFYMTWLSLTLSLDQTFYQYDHLKFKSDTVYGRQLACESTDVNFSIKEPKLDSVKQRVCSKLAPVVLISSIILLTLVTLMSPFKCQRSSKEPNNNSDLSQNDLTDPADNKSLCHTDLELLAKAKVTNTIAQTLAVMEFVEIPNLEYYI